MTAKGVNKSKDFASVERQKPLPCFAPSASAPSFCHLFQALIYGKCLTLSYAIRYPYESKPHSQ